MSTRVKLSELLDAYDWVSVEGPFENLAYISRAIRRYLGFVPDLLGDDPWARRW